jgi:hypothetical protein
MGQFSVGEVVTCIPHLICRSAAAGDYKIVGEMPLRDGDRTYRIKSPLEEHERVVGESLLIRSDGHLPEERLAESKRPGSITLPKLRIALRTLSDDEADNWSVASMPEH